MMDRRIIRFLAVAALTAALTAILAADATAASKTRVACWNKKYPFEPNAEPVFRKRPNRCVFVKRGEFANAFTVEAKSIGWKRWRSGQARGKGKDFIGMGVGFEIVRIRLSKPVSRCGRRVFSKAHFRFPAFDSGGGFRLDTC